MGTLDFWSKIYFALLVYPSLTLVVSLSALGLQVLLSLLKSKAINKFYIYTVNIILIPLIAPVIMDVLGAIFAVLSCIFMWNWAELTKSLSLLGELGLPLISILIFPILSRYIYRYSEHSVT